MSESFNAADLHYTRLEAGRPHVREAVWTIVRRYVRGERFTSIDLPPRSGKSSVIHCAALEFAVLDVPWTLAVAPWDLLPDQLLDAEKIGKSIDRYCDPKPDWAVLVHRVENIGDHKFWKREGHQPAKGRRVVLLGATLPLIYLNEKIVLDAITYTVERFGKRPALQLDEAHLLAAGEAGNKWGAFAERAADAGAYLSFGTGTAVRSDGAPLPGFNALMGDEWQERQQRIRSKKVDPATGDVTHFIDTYDVLSRDGTQKADYQLSWQKAWTSGFLNHINVHWADGAIVLDGRQTLISEIKNEKANGVLRSVVEAESVIEQVCKIAADRFYQWRKVYGLPTTKMLITCGSDLQRDKGDNYHPRAVRRAIQAALEARFGEDEARRINVQIATTTLADEGKEREAKHKIAAFRGDKKASGSVGEIDVLVVKTMGLVGLDVPELKVGACLSTLREGPMMLQERSRTLTVWEVGGAKDRPSDLILPRDPANQRFIEKMMEANGVRESTSTLADRTEVDPLDDVQPPPEVVDAWYAAVEDITGALRDQDEQRRAHVDMIRARFRSARTLTDVRILDLAEEGAFPLPEEDVVRWQRPFQPAEPGPGVEVVNMGDDAEKLRGRFGRRAQELVSLLVDRAVNPATWTDRLKRLQYAAKQRAGVAIPVSSVDDPETLRRLLYALEEEFRVQGGARVAG